MRPGRKFREIHATAIRVIAEYLHEWGLLPEGVASRTPSTRSTASTTAAGWCTAPATTSASTCTTARRPRRESTRTACSSRAWCFTVEPGLYFKPDDLTVPERFRGIGVRIEDDMLVTADGCENLSAAMPRRSADVEAWIARVQSR